MKQKVLLTLATFTHPVLLALVIIPVEYEDYAWFVYCSALIAPVLLLGFLKMDFKDPENFHRRMSYLVFGFIYFMLGFVFDSLGGEFAMKWYYSMAFIVAFLWLMSWRIKISWHVSFWTVPTTVFMLFLVESIDPKAPLSNDWLLAMLLAVLPLSLVILIRYWQKAHTLRELFFAVLSGVVITLLCFICIS